MKLLVASILLISVGLCFGASNETEGEGIGICKCSEVRTCKDKVGNAFFPCLEECKSHVSDAGGDFPAFEKCLVTKKGSFKQALTCMGEKLNGSCVDES